MEVATVNFSILTFHFSPNFCNFAGKNKGNMARNNHFFISSFTFLITHFSFRKYPLSLSCLALIFLLSFTPFFPETPLDDVAFIDKWTHLVMYGGTTSVIWWEYLRNCRKEVRRPNFQKLLCYALCGMVILGGLVELGQAYCTTNRSGEWLDFFADTVGVLLGNLLGWLLYLSTVRH